MNKKLCIGLAALTSAFMLSGCFGKNDPPPSNPTLTTAQKNEAYTSLRTISNAPLYDTTSATGSQITVKTSMSVDTSTDFSKSGLNSSDIEDLKENLASGYADFNLGIGAKAITGLRADNTGYLKGYGSILGIEVLAAQEITRKEGNNYYVYSKVDTEKTKSLVDENYAKNTYSLANFFGDDEDSTASLADLELLQDILTSIADNETLDEFKLVASNIAKNAIANNQEGNFATYFTGIDVSNISAAAAVDITLTDGVFYKDFAQTINAKHSLDNMRLAVWVGKNGNTSNVNGFEVYQAFEVKLNGNPYTAVEFVSDDTKLVVYQEGDKLCVTGIEEGDVLSVYSMEGRLMMQETATFGKVQLDLNGLTKGAYLLQTNGSYVKFVK